MDDDEAILCPRCMEEGRINHIGAFELNAKGNTVNSIYCEKHGKIAFTGNLDMLSVKHVRKTSLAGLKKYTKLTAQLGLMSLSKGAMKAKDLVGRFLQELDEPAQETKKEE